jgi:predicted phosphodiesterase
MFFGVLGDIHGEFDALYRAIDRQPEAAFWLSVGDVASDDMCYPQPAAPLYWIQGNNEDFGFIAGLETGRPASVDDGPARESSSLHFLANGTCTRINGLAVAALGGTFAPTWYETPAAELPFPGSPGLRSTHGAPFRHPKDDKRRHFVREQVALLKAMRDIDVLLTHEAPRPFIVQAGTRRLDAGKTAVNELLAAMRPRLHFFGHHHRFADARRDGVRSIGLDLVSRSFVLVDSESFEVTKVEA